MCSWLLQHFPVTGSSRLVSTWLFEPNPIIMQGTKVLKDREIRHAYCQVYENAPPQHISAEVIKYTGALVSPEWRDIEKGIVHGFRWYFLKSTHSRKDKFETLCSVEADLSTAPYTSGTTAAGKKWYSRSYDIILLVGLAELKAQVSWIDSKTVSARTFLRRIRLPNPTFMCVDLEDREKVCSTTF